MAAYLAQNGLHQQAVYILEMAVTHVGLIVPSRSIAASHHRTNLAMYSKLTGTLNEVIERFRNRLKTSIKSSGQTSEQTQAHRDTLARLLSSAGRPSEAQQIFTDPDYARPKIDFNFRNQELFLSTSQSLDSPPTFTPTKIQWQIMEGTPKG
jgi:hypothetical protein